METKKMTYMQALRLAMDEEMARDEKVAPRERRVSRNLYEFIMNKKWH